MSKTDDAFIDAVNEQRATLLRVLAALRAESDENGFIALADAEKAVKLALFVPLKV